METKTRTPHKPSFIIAVIPVIVLLGTMITAVKVWGLTLTFH